MKFNWGTGITIVIILFMGFILAMVFKATRTNADLHAPDYYEQEINYQERIEAVSNAEEWEESIELVQDESRVRILFPGIQIEKGTIEFYKPDNARLDIVYQMEPGSSIATVQKTNLVEGLYEVKIQWETDGKQHYVSRSLTVN